MKPLLDRISERLQVAAAVMVVAASWLELGGVVLGAEEFRVRPSSGEPKLLVAEDLDLDLVLQEPRVAKPLYLTFDERGRLWVVEYRQYPWPAGLKLLSHDSVWRNIYDPPFAPPPPHAADSPFRGRDRISIHEDSDGDGCFDQHKVFLDGLNLATAALPGRGGVFVLNPPYLLFYADRDRDDVPDEANPDVLLSGFGFEDSHSLANSLRWGPDGWIYGTQGSTVSSNVVVHSDDGQPRVDRPAIRSMGQNVWRYHPERRRYEVFAEGGGNAFGVEIDAAGRIYSGHNGGDTRGFHYLPGGYWQKTFAKHGQLSNPYAFDYHRPMRHNAAQRFTHTFAIYEADQLPPRYRGRMFALNPIEHCIPLCEITPDGSSRQTHDLGEVVRPSESEQADWFTPVDIQIGPDGALYIADWHSAQANHYHSHEGQIDPSIGRVYRLRGGDYSPSKPADLASLTSSELVEQCLRDPNRWRRQQARRILGDRRDPAISARLWDLVRLNDDQLALEALWALEVSIGLDARQLEAALAHSNADVRGWAAQLIADRDAVSPECGAALLMLAKNETVVEVRCRLASAAKRLPAAHGVPIAFELSRRTEDASDVYLPRTIWWALEAHADRRDFIFAELHNDENWRSAVQVAGLTMPQCFMKRWAIAGRGDDLRSCAELLELAPDDEQVRLLVAVFAASFEGRPLPPLPDALAAKLASVGGPLAELIAVRRRDPAAVAAAIKSAADPSVADDRRIALINALGDAGAAPQDALPMLTDRLTQADSPSVKCAAINALLRYGEADSGRAMLAAWPQLDPSTRLVAIHALSSRREWIDELLAAVEHDTVDRSLLDADLIARMRRVADSPRRLQLDQLFPRSDVKLSDIDARVEEVTSIVKGGVGSPLAGKDLYEGKLACGKCHRLFGQGGDLGPELTAYNRANVGRMALAVVHPNAEIREGFETYTAITDDGRALSGFKVEQTPESLVLRGVDGQLHYIRQDEIEEMGSNAESLMPLGLLDGLTEAEIRDLFAYLSSTTPPM
ncbi:MAG: c-type cytochrome [Planctomycetaceae bacterium]|nr:c-type cytochrome [Planctomycetaceae bacterium]